METYCHETEAEMDQKCKQDKCKREESQSQWNNMLSKPQWEDRGIMPIC